VNETFADEITCSRWMSKNRSQKSVIAIINSTPARWMVVIIKKRLIGLLCP